MKLARSTVLENGEEQIVVVTADDGDDARDWLEARYGAANVLDLEMLPI